MILDEEPSYRRRLFSEMMYIACQKNGINIQTDTDLLDKSYFPIIHKFSQP